MVTKSQKARLGIFILAAVAVLIIALAILSYSRFFKDKDIYYIAYENVSVSGLDVGSPVKYLGIKVGNVSEISIDQEDINTVIVTVSINEGTPIKEDVKAEIATIGITGLKLIELRGGSNAAETLQAGDYIKAGRSFTEDITGKAEVIAEKVEQVVNNLITFSSKTNQDKIFAMIEQASASLEESQKAIEKLNEIIAKNETQLNRTIANIDTVSRVAINVGRSTEATVESIRNIVESDTVKTTINRIAGITKTLEDANIYDLINRLNNALVSANRILKETESMVHGNKGNIVRAIDDMNRTMRSLKNVSRMIEEDPSVLLLGSEPENPPDEKLER